MRSSCYDLLHCYCYGFHLKYTRSYLYNGKISLQCSQGPKTRVVCVLCALHVDVGILVYLEQQETEDPYASNLVLSHSCNVV